VAFTDAQRVMVSFWKKDQKCKATINWWGEQPEQLLALAMMPHQQALLCLASTVAVLSLLIVGGF